MTVLLGAFAASSLTTATEFGAPHAADAADARHAGAQQSEKFPEFVPVVNFSEFVLAMQSYAARNPTASREAAEVLSAKFGEQASEDGVEPTAAADPVAEQKPAPVVALQTPAAPRVIVPTAPFATRSVADAPSAPDPGKAQMKLLADPVKVATIRTHRKLAGPRLAKAEAKAEKPDKKIASAGRERVEKRFQPAMGLGMVFDSAEDAPPMSSLTQGGRATSQVKRGGQ
jgi:hypothetical protein